MESTISGSCLSIPSWLDIFLNCLLAEDDHDVFEAVAHHRLGLTAEVVGCNPVRWSASQLSNESALPRTTDSTP